MSLESIVRKYKDDKLFRIKSQIKHHTPKILAGLAMAAIISPVFLSKEYLHSIMSHGLLSPFTELDSPPIDELMQEAEAYGDDITSEIYDRLHDKHVGDNVNYNIASYLLMKGSMCLPPLVYSFKNEWGKKINPIVYGVGTGLLLSSPYIGFANYILPTILKDITKEIKNPFIWNAPKLFYNHYKKNTTKVLSCFDKEGKNEYLRSISESPSSKNKDFENLLKKNNFSPLDHFISYITSITAKTIYQKVTSKLNRGDYNAFSELPEDGDNLVMKAFAITNFMNQVDKNPERFDVVSLSKFKYTREDVNEMWKKITKDLAADEAVFKSEEMHDDLIFKKGDIEDEYLLTKKLHDKFPYVVEPFSHADDLLILRYLEGVTLEKVTDMSVLETALTQMKEIHNGTRNFDLENVDYFRHVANKYPDSEVFGKKYMGFSEELIDTDYVIDLDPHEGNLIASNRSVTHLDFGKNRFASSLVQLPKFICSNDLLLEKDEEMICEYYADKRDDFKYGAGAIMTAFSLAPETQFSVERREKQVEHAIKRVENDSILKCAVPDLKELINYINA